MPPRARGVAVAAESRRATISYPAWPGYPARRPRAYLRRGPLARSPRRSYIERVYQTQIKIIPPSSIAQYVSLSPRASLIWSIWRCEGGSSPLNVILGHDPHGPPHFTDCQNKHHKRISGCSNPKPRPSRPIGGGVLRVYEVTLG